MKSELVCEHFPVIKLSFLFSTKISFNLCSIVLSHFVALPPVLFAVCRNISF